MSENIVCKTAVVANITEISTKQLCEFSDKQILRLSGRPQPFLEYSPETLYELVESIKEHGIINPVTVRENKNGKYEILSGRNRVRAAKKLGIRSVPAIINPNSRRNYPKRDKKRLKQAIFSKKNMRNT